MAKRGRPFEPGNQFSRGRPRGSRNKRNLKTLDLLYSHSEPLLRKAMMEGLKGDNVLLGKFLPYLLGPVREAPVKIGSIPLITAADLSQASAQVLKKVASGDLGIKEAQALVDLMAVHRELILSESLVKRIEALENEPRRNQENEPQA
jgi:hypothetical protein